MSAHSTSTGEVQVETTVTSQSPQRFCIYHTPFEGLRSKMFRVTHEEHEELPYRGRMAKRRAPQPKHFRDTSLGSPQACTVTLGKSYDLSRPGRYSVQFIGNDDVNGLPNSNITWFDVP